MAEADRQEIVGLLAIRGTGIENEDAHCSTSNCTVARRRSCPEQPFAYYIARTENWLSLIQGMETQVSKGNGRVVQRQVIPRCAQKHTRRQKRVRPLERCTLATCVPAPRTTSAQDAGDFFSLFADRHRSLISSRRQFPR